jgi:N utilization substance protein A
VVIREEDLAQAIGREGQNIRLASKMLDKEIDVFGDEEFTNMTEEQRAAVLSETGAAPAVQEAVVEETPAGDQAAETTDETPAAAEVAEAEQAPVENRDE